MKVVLDIETTFTKDGKKTDPSPYHHANKLVSFGMQVFDTYDFKEYSDYYFVGHKERKDDTASFELQTHLGKATLVIGHNLKFDMSWLLECGYRYAGEYWDTMIFEYIIAKGLKPALSLAACCEKYGLSKKLDNFSTHMKAGLNTDEMPIDELEEYGRADVQATYELYKRQMQRIEQDPELQSMLPAIKLSMQVLPILIDMERSGIKIDTETLSSVEQEYREESARLEKLLTDMAAEVMGDRPINLNSPEHLSWVIYSRKVNDKKAWAELFNIGTEERGSVTKSKYVRRYKPTTFKRIVLDNMTTLRRLDAEQCSVCEGRGWIQKVKKDGTNHKRTNACSSCSGSGFSYLERSDIAGFKVQPLSSEYATVNGFAADKTTIQDLIAAGKLSPKAKEFLECLSRYNAIQTYLSTFVEGIQKNVRYDGLLHTTFNQCVTATGRLSSSNPNFQNLPRGKTFPVRKTITSRFKNGYVLEADFAQLEFRGAAMLSGCKVALNDIVNNVDIHSFTAAVLTEAGQDTDRQGAKQHSFKPLYGGLSGTDAEVTYYKAFLDKYTGIKAWHERLVNSAIAFKQIQTPSGRIFAFPNARRISSDRVTGKTQIVNYPVQSFATADIVWLVIREIYLEMKLKALKSKLVLQVHDSIAADVYPDEVDIVKQIFVDSFNKTPELLKTYFNFHTDVPIGYEIKLGKNLMEMEAV